MSARDREAVRRKISSIFNRIALTFRPLVSVPIVIWTREPHGLSRLSDQVPISARADVMDHSNVVDRSNKWGLQRRRLYGDSLRTPQRGNAGMQHSAALPVYDVALSALKEADTMRRFHAETMKWLIKPVLSEDVSFDFSRLLSVMELCWNNFEK
jgi:hypothetical protein